MTTETLGKFPLLLPDYEALYDRDTEIISLFPVLWMDEYQEEFAESVRIAIGRGREQISKINRKVSAAGLDVVLILERPPKNVHLRGDYRYPSETMTAFLCNTDFDLIPVLVGWTSAGGHLLDGHHRWRAYLAAGIRPLILSITLHKQSGDVPQIVVELGESAMTRGRCHVV
jgi:hypothetical protein